MTSSKLAAVVGQLWTGLTEALQVWLVWFYCCCCFMHHHLHRATVKPFCSHHRYLPITQTQSELSKDNINTQVLVQVSLWLWWKCVCQSKHTDCRKMLSLCFCGYSYNTTLSIVFFPCCVFVLVPTLIMLWREQANILLNAALMSNMSTSLRLTITLIRVLSSVPAPCIRLISHI